MNMKQLLLCIAFLAFISASAQTYQIGHTTVTFADPTRTGGFGSGGGTGRQIQCEVYYPAGTAGDGVPVSGNNHPVVVFGHGFVMAWDAYQNVWEDLVPKGYIVVFPRTEGGISPSHGEFGADIAFVGRTMQTRGTSDPTFAFYQKTGPTTALMGHSMGGGAALLAAQNNVDITCVAVFAAAETNPSAVTAAANIKVPILILAGANDCVTPPNTNTIPMYNNCGSKCKTLVTITGASHCQFAESNFNCNFGEATCSPSPTISRAQQHTTQAIYYVKFLNKYLKGICSPNSDFESALSSGVGITSYQQSCTPQAGNDQTVCAGTPVTLGSTVMDGYTFSWTSIPAGYSGQGFTPQVTPTTITTYVLTYTNQQSNCVVIDSVTIYAGPVVNAGGDAITCQQAPVQLGSAPVNGYTYAWTSSPAGFTANTAQVNVQPTTTTTYYLSVTDGSNCHNSDTVTVFVNNPPQPQVVALGSLAFCAGDSTALQAANFTNVLWLPGGQTTNTIIVADSGNYSFIVNPGEACADTSNIVTTVVNPLPQILINADIYSCSNGTVELLGPPGFAGYLWQPGQEQTQNIEAPGGEYFLTATDSNGCSGTVAHYYVEQFPVTPLGVVQQGDTLLANPNNPNWQYQWYYNNQLLVNDTSGFCLPPQEGDYYIIAYDTYGCQVFSDTVTYTPVGLSYNQASGISIYPNPATDRLMVDLNVVKGTVVLNLINGVGQLVQSLNANNTLQEVYIEGLPTGLYTLLVTINGQSHGYKVVVE